jgi:uncharacterized repeat protein (TIGR03803 family)
MRIGLSRYVLITGAAAALLAACGGSQLPIGAPGVKPQIFARAAREHSTSYRVVYAFGATPDGNFPVGNLIDVAGTLYGTTARGGAASSCGARSGYGPGGTVFSITLSGTEKVIHSFGGASDGCYPSAGLIDIAGTLYGTTAEGGNYGCGIYSGYNYDACGTVFSITPDGTEKVLHYFGSYGTGDGDSPTAPLTAVKGILYGTTSQGGSNICAGSGYPFHCGTVFTIARTGSERLLYDFHSGTNGHYPRAGLIGEGRALYGTTYSGGNYSCGSDGCGTVFRVTTGGKEKTLHAFGYGNDGRFPNAGLVEVNGTFYGTTKAGGSYSCNCGTVFSITPDGTEKVLHSFDKTDGSEPDASLIDLNGTLYGTASGGGAFGKGTVFSITTTGHQKVLHSFSGGSDGIAPYAGLLNVNGTLYGTTSGGFGFDGYGTVFALTP